jgi:hypothetical protein
MSALVRQNKLFSVSASRISELGLLRVAQAHWAGLASAVSAAAANGHTWGQVRIFSIRTSPWRSKVPYGLQNS